MLLQSTDESSQWSLGDALSVDPNVRTIDRPTTALESVLPPKWSGTNWLKRNAT
jgi:hypothetical protein